MPWEENHKLGAIKPILYQMSGVGLSHVGIAIGVIPIFCNRLRLCCARIGCESVNL